jgi:hypothetical protein
VAGSRAARCAGHHRRALAALTRGQGAGRVRRAGRGRGLRRGLALRRGRAMAREGGLGTPRGGGRRAREERGEEGRKKRSRGSPWEERRRCRRTVSRVAPIDVGEVEEGRERNVRRG